MPQVLMLVPYSLSDEIEIKLARINQLIIHHEKVFCSIYYSLSFVEFFFI